MKQALALALSMALAGSMFAAEPPQDASAPAKSTKKMKTPSVSSQLSELKEAMEAQQKQIQDLGQQLQSRDQRIQQLEQRLDQNQAAAAAAQSKADAVAAQDAQQEQSVSALKTDVSDLKLNNTNMAATLQDTQKSLREQLESPLAIHFKGVTITPGGFLAAESVWRNRGLGSDINTPFNSVNMPNAGANAVSEFYGSGRQSRISMLVEGKLKDVKMTGYYEADFLSAGLTSNNNQSNSYTLRQRQVWGQLASSQWSLTGGQMWSLVTETKKGMDNRSEALPMTIDPQYTVGFSWARQYGIRLVRNFNNHFWLGASLENPQTTFSARTPYNDFALGSPGSGGGLYNGGITGVSCTTTATTNPTTGLITYSTICPPSNAANYSFNAMPDFVIKAAAEPGFGHYEVFGIVSRYRDRVYPCEEGTTIPALFVGLLPANCNGTLSSLGAYNDSQTAVGLGANARITLAKQVDIGGHFLTGQGVGRYGTGGLPDATVNPDGTLGLIRSTQALATLEWHTKRLDLYLNGGEEYAQRHSGVGIVPTITSGGVITPVATGIGYGSPLLNLSSCYSESAPSANGSSGFNFGSGCSADTQRLVEGTIGFWIKVHQGPHGRLQFGPQYSYVARDAWAGCSAALNSGVCTSGFTAPHGIDNMFLTSFRYYLP